ncbi:MAG: hypothetical protein JNL49_11220 [Bacteroidia bacterium]|nr:hypothetical protein [Bacteroidia bacterium]
MEVPVFRVISQYLTAGTNSKVISLLSPTPWASKKYSDVKASVVYEGEEIDSDAKYVSLPIGNSKALFPTFFTGPLTKLLFEAPVAVEPCFIVRRLVLVVIRFPCMNMRESSILRVEFAVTVPADLLMASFLNG